MSRIHFVGGEKGGVGKSLVSRVLSQWFIDRGAPFAGVDADVSHATLLRSYGAYVQRADLEDFASADEIINRALGADRSVVVDLPAQSHRAFARWIRSADVVRFAGEVGIGLTLWHVTDGTVDSVQDLDRTLDDGQGAFRYVVVKNQGRGKDFSYFEESAARRRLAARGAHVIELPELDAATMARIDRTRVTLWTAIRQAEGESALAPLQRQRARLWLERCYGALGPPLVPEP